MASPSRSGSTSNVMNRQSKPPLLERLLDEVLRGVPRRRVGDEATLFNERSAGHGVFALLNSPAILAGFQNTHQYWPNPSPRGSRRPKMGRLDELAANCLADYSDAWLPTVQRRYHMPQRSPVIFWLLLAATISVDAVAYYWVVSENSPNSSIAIDALFTVQVSVVCIWSGLGNRRTVWTRIAPWLAALGASLVRGTSSAKLTGAPLCGMGEVVFDSTSVSSSATDGRSVAVRTNSILATTKPYAAKLAFFAESTSIGDDGCRRAYAAIAHLLMCAASKNLG